jgi:hypothetical protein
MVAGYAALRREVAKRTGAITSNSTTGCEAGPREKGQELELFFWAGVPVR